MKVLKTFLLLFLVSLWSSTVVEAGDSVIGSWEGHVQISNRKFRIEVRFKATSRGLQAQLDMPDTRTNKVPLTNVLFGSPSVHFELRRGQVRAVFHGNLEKNEIRGSFIRGKVVGRFALQRKADEKTESLASLVPRFKRLPDAVSMTVMELGENPVTIAQIHSASAAAIGSSFKLYILGALLSDIKSGKKKWDQVIAIQKQRRSLPAGLLQSWPEGSPVTIQTAATLMLTISDNTAADHLLFALGRQRVEAILPLMGNQQARNRPFLATYEMFFLKSRDKPRGQQFLKLNLPRRRVFIDSLKSLDRQSIQFTRVPKDIDTIEWFATSAELCVAMDWIRRETESGDGRRVRDILKINPGSKVIRKPWSYIGYKGGSEPGVFNLTYLLQKTDGRWYALSCTVNNSKEKVARARMSNLVRRAINAVGRRK